MLKIASLLFLATQPPGFENSPTLFLYETAYKVTGVSREVTELFRKEVRSGQVRQSLGKVICIGPLSVYIFGLSLAIIFLVLLLFLSLGRFQPEKIVPGVLIPDKGMDYVYSPVSGTVTTINAVSGARLKTDHPLLKVRVDNNTSSLASDQRQKMAFQDGQEVTVNTGEAGTLVTLLVGLGAHIHQNEPVAMLFPKGAVLEAEIFVPADAVRLVHKGQQVTICYTAYPWQTYGIYKGTITSVGNVLFEPGDIKYTRGLHKPFYQARARLRSPFITFNSERIAPGPGTRLSAALLLPEVSLWHWMFSGA